MKKKRRERHNYRWEQVMGERIEAEVSKLSPWDNKKVR